MKIAILFGSSSNEHEVSIASATSIIKNLDKKKYQITPIYLDKENNFYKYQKNINKIDTLKVGNIPTELKRIKDPFKYLKKFDKAFIMIHGKNGEDGILSSILEFLNIEYIGHDLYTSTVTMDKILTKTILEENNIKTAKFLYFTKYNEEFIYKNATYSLGDIQNIINDRLNYPLFVKPSRSGSSIGIVKVSNKKDLKKAIKEALEQDNRILIEEEVKGHELECGILEKENNLIASSIGEVKAGEDFYSFEAKYKNNASEISIPAHISEEKATEIKEIAKKAFKVLGLHNFSRVDFFLTNNNEIILNEINTIPGFTEISMYPKLFQDIGISYSELLDTLIGD